MMVAMALNRVAPGDQPEQAPMVTTAVMDIRAQRAHRYGSNCPGTSPMNRSTYWSTAVQAVNLARPDGQVRVANPRAASFTVPMAANRVVRAKPGNRVMLARQAP